MFVYRVAIVRARGYRDTIDCLRFIPGLSSSAAVEYFQEESSYTLCLRPCVRLKENRMSRRNGDRSRFHCCLPILFAVDRSGRTGEARVPVADFTLMCTGLSTTLEV